MKLGDKVNGMTIVGIKTIKHGKLFPNRNITHRLALTGKKGAQYNRDVFASGTMGRAKRCVGGFGYFEGEHALDGTK